MPDLKPESADTASGPSVDEWLGAFRAAVADQRKVFEQHRGVEARSQYDGIGEGGDDTLVIDRLCEDTIFEQLDRLHAAGHEFTAISEERGTVAFGDSPTRLVIDPIDGSLNARRTIPFHSVSIAVATGGSMAAVRLGYVYDFGASEEWVAVAGQGATVDGHALSVIDADGLEVVGVESTKPERLLAVTQALDGKTYRVRTPGSIAISLCWVAANRFDAMISTRNCRSVDAAAGQLIVREAGGVLSFDDGGLEDAALDLSARYDIAAARTAADLATVREAQKQVP
jgi:myo-inositol-1(or 4)-monophosphatase